MTMLTDVVKPLHSLSSFIHLIFRQRASCRPIDRFLPGVTFDIHQTFNSFCEQPGQDSVKDLSIKIVGLVYIEFVKSLVFGVL